MSRRGVASCLFIALFLWMPAAEGRGKDTVRVDGVVLDRQHRRLSGVTLVVAHTASGVGRSATTDEEGRFDLGNMQPGEYEVQGTSVEGQILFSQGHTIGKELIKPTDGSPAEHLLIVVGEEIRSLSDTGRKRRRPAPRGVLGPPTLSRRWNGSFHGVFGARSLDDFWSPNEDQGGGGFDVGFGRWDWPVHIAIGIHFSQDESREKVECLILPFCDMEGSLRSKAKLWELNLGVSRSFRPEKRMRPFVGGGIALVDIDWKITDVGSDGDRSEGFFVRGGLAWSFLKHPEGQRLGLGLEGKWLFGTDVEVFETATDVDYFQLAVILSVNW